MYSGIGIVDWEVAVEQLDDLLDDEGEAEREQQLVRMPESVHAAQHEALDQDTAGADDDRRGDQAGPEPDRARAA